ncbi:hypothetical protein K2173_006367 [Erythroxylum novogranatense]|uniref:Thioredoxin domain-containing protein n=1 Tax=Erythroxylum novogranatense TaxID=1862640 RepID=A0AAV8U347_9ROSI|nr:hypothetical protein K2173_006367 [Erythroxylum novogranatense]
MDRWQFLRRGRTLKVSSSDLHQSHVDSDKNSSGVVVDVKSTGEWKSIMEASKEKQQLLVIEFTATWCGPCKLMEQTLQEFAAMYTNVDFIKIDVDQLVGVARQFKVMVMPTFALVKKGEEVARVTGVRKNELQDMIEQYRHD